jgi:putative inorganic carbon (hco3(-)) transporter
MTALSISRWSFLALIFSLFWMKYPVMIGGLAATPADFLFLMSVGAWAVSLLLGETKLRWHPAFWLLLAYFAAMALSVPFSADRPRSAFKLAAEAYLLLLPVLTYNLLDSTCDVKQAFRAWLGGSGILAAMGIGTLLLFPFIGWHSFLLWPLHHFGTLPPGPYPRLELTFVYPSIMANYLTVSLMLVLLAERLRWIGRKWAILLGAAVGFTALFALTPGFGGLLAMLAVWLWFAWRARHGLMAILAVCAAAILAGLEVLVAAVTPILHPTAPFLIKLPGIPILAPAVRLLTWMDSWRTFLASPLVGRGLGLEAAHVAYLSPEGRFGYVTDAHNMFLNIGAQCGIAGIAALLSLTGFIARKLLKALPDNELLFGFSLAFLSCFVVQGLVGSFENGRHIWILFGLVLVADRIRFEPVPDAGFEPATFGLQNRCSTN